jgi:xylulokinase
MDGTGHPLYRAKLWNDTSTVEECDIITQAFGGRARLLAEAGNPILPGYTASKVLWFKRHEPKRYAAMKTILLPHDYLNYFLTGNYAMEAGDASGTGWFDVRRRTWQRDVLKAIDAERDLLGCLPQLIASSDAVGTLRPEFAAKYGFPEGVVVSAGGGDNMMAAIGTGCVAPGAFTVSLGTSGTLFAYSDKPVNDPQGIVAAFCSSTGGFLPLVCTMNCTVSTEVMRELLDLKVGELDKLAASVRPGSDGLLTLPFYCGERTPNLPNARGCILGATTQNLTSAHLIRSAKEGALYALKFGQEAFCSLGTIPKQICLTGGGSESLVWRTLAANVFGCPVVKPTVKETAAFGAALQALWTFENRSGNASAIVDLVTQHVPTDGSAVLPENDVRSLYETSYRSYLEYVGLLTPKFS